MSLIDEIRDGAVDENNQLGTTLRKCQVLASKLGSKPLEDWLICESNGYPDDIDVPDYRKSNLTIQGNFWDPFGNSIKNWVIPPATLPEKAKEIYANYPFRESISTIQSTLESIKENGGSIRLETKDLKLLLEPIHNYKCAECWAVIDTAKLTEILNTVRSRILDFILAIEEQYPNLEIESPSDAQHKPKPEAATNIFNTTINNSGSANIIGSASHSHFNTNTITPGNFESLSAFLKDQGVTEDDIQELQSAIQEDPQPEDSSSFGPKVAGWIGKMATKAAQGIWKIGSVVAVDVVTKAVAKYHGWH